MLSHLRGQPGLLTTQAMPPLPPARCWHQPSQPPCNRLLGLACQVPASLALPLLELEHTEEEGAVEERHAHQDGQAHPLHKGREGWQRVSSPPGGGGRGLKVSACRAVQQVQRTFPPSN